MKRLSLTAFAVLALVSCIDEKQDILRLRGNEVVFGASTLYENGALTRTS